ncbi:MAG: tRNA pseudouridine(13) synthase TruD [Candidatus Hodarchaeales archaeon]
MSIIPLNIQFLNKISGISSYLTDPALNFPLTLNRNEEPENFQVFEIPPSGSPLLNLNNKSQLGQPKIGLFYHAILSKRLIDTSQAISQLAQKLRVPKDWIGYAGLKDAHAITHQRISIYNFDLAGEELIKFPRFQVSGFLPKRYGIKLGALTGNYFKILLSFTNSDENKSDFDCKRFNEIIEKIKTLGFPNFFGLQRFGSQRPISHFIGQFLLKKEWKKAVDLYLMTSSIFEKKDIQDYRQCLEKNQNYDEFIEKMPKFYQYERLMAISLKDYPNNYFRALNQLPRNILRLFVGSYQSYVFNRLVSQTLQGNVEKIPKKLPIIGSETNLSNYSGETQELVTNILEKTNITFTNFQSSIPWLKQKGQERRVIIKPLEIKNKLITVKKNKKGVILEFGLPKGCYGTILLREILKPKLNLNLTGNEISQEELQKILKFPELINEF